MRRHAIRAARRLCLLVAALGLAVPMGLAGAAPAQAAQRLPHWRTATLPLSGVLTGESELIAVTGSISVAVLTWAKASGGGKAQIVSALGETTGVGRTTGDTYSFGGADIDTVSFPSFPIGPLTVHPTFLEVSPYNPPDPFVPPHPVSPVRVAVGVTGSGEITSIDAEWDDSQP
jgi:hypothetical protein